MLGTVYRLVVDEKAYPVSEPTRELAVCFHFLVLSKLLQMAEDLDIDRYTAWVSESVEPLAAKDPVNLDSAYVNAAIDVLLARCLRGQTVKFGGWTWRLEKRPAPDLEAFSKELHDAQVRAEATSAE